MLIIIDDDSKKLNRIETKYLNGYTQLITRISVVIAPLEIVLPAQAFTMCLSAFWTHKGKEYKC